MADAKITALTALTGASLAATDPLPIVDISDTTQDASGTSKKITADEFGTGISKLLAQPVTIDAGDARDYADLEVADGAAQHPTDTVTFPGNHITDGYASHGISYTADKSWGTTDVAPPTGVASVVTTSSVGVDTSTFAGSGKLYVKSTTGFATSGTCYVDTAGSNATITYTGVSSDGGGPYLSGCTTTSGGGVLFKNALVQKLGAVGPLGPAFIHLNPARWSLDGVDALAMYGLFMRGGLGWSSSTELHNSFGAYLALTPEGSSTFGNLYGLYVTAQPAGTVDRYVGIEVTEKVLEGGTITESIGLKISGMGRTGGTGKGIQIDGDIPSWFGGSLSLGQEADPASAYRLDIRGGGIYCEHGGETYSAAATHYSLFVGDTADIEFASGSSGSFYGIAFDSDWEVADGVTMTNGYDLFIKGQQAVDSTHEGTVTSRWGAYIETEAWKGTNQYGLHLVPKISGSSGTAGGGVTNGYGILLAPSNTTTYNWTNYYGIDVNFTGCATNGINAVGLRIQNLAVNDLGSSMGLQVDDVPSQHRGMLGLGGSAITTEPTYGLQFHSTSQDRGVIALAEAASTPTNPSASNQLLIYHKSDRIIFGFLDGATMRYKSLLMTGTGTTWAHATTGP